MECSPHACLPGEVFAPLPGGTVPGCCMLHTRSHLLWSHTQHLYTPATLPCVPYTILCLVILPQLFLFPHSVCSLPVLCAGLPVLEEGRRGMPLCLCLPLLPLPCACVSLASLLHAYLCHTHLPCHAFSCGGWSACTIWFSFPSVNSPTYYCLLLLFIHSGRVPYHTTIRYHYTFIPLPLHSYLGGRRRPSN